MSKKRYYFSDWNEDDIEGSISLHCVDKEAMNFIINVLDPGYTYEADITENIIEKLYVNDHEDLKCIGENIKIPDIEINPRHIFLLERTNVGNHFIGGEKPKNFHFPYDIRLKTPFQYIGMIDGEDPFMNWIGFDKFHIVFPIYECLWSVTLDYSDPLSPKVIELGMHSHAWYDSTGDVGHIVTEKIFYVAGDALPQSYDEYKPKELSLLAGIPYWYQGISKLPRCPYTGEVLRFICELKSYRENIILNADDVFEKHKPGVMIIDTLLLFVNPKNKVVHIIRIFD